MSEYGSVAAGHKLTAEAGLEVLKAGGNAFDAAMAAFFMACVAEPVLASPGGGGFLLAKTEGDPVLFDFFTQTPGRKCAGETEFYPIEVDFGTVIQEFHIGLGSAAVPGAVKGIFEVHRRYGRMPVTELVKPAVESARNGIEVEGIMPYLFKIVSPIYLSSPEARELYESRLQPGKVLQQGDTLEQINMADFIESLADEGPDLFYRGEIAAAIDRDCRSGKGHLCRQDFENYRVITRKPLNLRYHEAEIWTNPQPSLGGLLIMLGLQLLQPYKISQFGHGSEDYLQLLGRTMAVMNAVKRNSIQGIPQSKEEALDAVDPELLQALERVGRRHPQFPRGTTHISIIDGQGQVATMTLSNGEGCGYIIPGCGFMLNNMLGEEDLNPAGFHLWETDRRIASMMAPTLIHHHDRQIATGSGGSNRIRTALMQLIINCVDYGMTVEQAVLQPRVHYEHGTFNAESGFPEENIRKLTGAFEDIKIWPDLNLYFGGAHTVCRNSSTGRFSGQGDPRRAGVCV